jgi:hypothetical protein
MSSNSPSVRILRFHRLSPAGKQSTWTINAVTGEVGDGTSLFGVRRAGTEIRKKASNKQRDATSPRNPH